VAVSVNGVGSTAGATHVLNHRSTFRLS
jgi:hypothetical protein